MLSYEILRRTGNTFSCLTTRIPRRLLFTLPGKSFMSSKRSLSQGKFCEKADKTNEALICSPYIYSESVNQSARPSCHLTIRPSVRLPVHPYVCLSVSRSVSPSVNESVCPSISPSVCLSVSRSVVQSASRSVSQSMSLSISPSFHPAITYLRLSTSS